MPEMEKYVNIRDLKRQERKAIIGGRVAVLLYFGRRGSEVRWKG